MVHNFQLMFSPHSQMIMDLLICITSSPRFPQSNGEAEHAIKTVKALLKKCDDRNEDHYLALIAYRVTPLEYGYSPAELLMSHMLRTNVPTFYKQLQPKVPNLSSL